MKLLLQSCMGGFCAQRDHCACYQTPFRGQPAERLCARGQEMPLPIEPPSVWRISAAQQPATRVLPEAA